MSSAARATSRVATCARALRAACDDAAFREARDELAGVLRDHAVHVLVVNGVPSRVRDDLAQAVTVTVLDRIVAGSVAPGLEEGYLAVAAKNRARDWHREESGIHEKMAIYEDDAFEAPDLDPCAVLEAAEQAERVQALAARVERVLEGAPPRYRDVLVAVYIEGTPIDTLVERELFKEWPLADGGDDAVAVRRRARARVDKLLQRARDWVRSRLLDEVRP